MKWRPMALWPARINARGARFRSEEVLAHGDVACILKCGEKSAQIAVRNGRDRSNPDGSGYGMDRLIKPIAIDLCRVLISTRTACKK